MNSIPNLNPHFQVMHGINGSTRNRCMMTTANRAAAWSWIEDKIFEDALVKFPEGVVNRWRRIAQCLPGKSLDDVIAHYEALLYDVGQIDSGRVELPSYSDEREERFGLMGTGRNSFGSLGGNVKRTQCERKKGKPWTVEEHRLFLLGLQIYGKSDWRSISRNLVVTRLPSQVASHAQKYFNRLKSEKKERKRSSIHDITSAADCLTVPQRSRIHDTTGAVDCLTVPQRSSIHDITSGVDCLTVPQRSSIHDITSGVDCLTVPQRSSIHDIPSAVDYLTVPQRSSIHDITSDVDCLAFPQSSNIHDIMSDVDCLTVPVPANPPLQERFPDFSFSM